MTIFLWKQKTHGAAIGTCFFFVFCGFLKKKRAKKATRPIHHRKWTITWIQCLYHSVLPSIESGNLSMDAIQQSNCFQLVSMCWCLQDYPIKLFTKKFNDLLQRYKDSRLLRPCNRVPNDRSISIQELPFFRHRSGRTKSRFFFWKIISIQWVYILRYIFFYSISIFRPLNIPLCQVITTSKKSI